MRTVFAMVRCADYCSSHIRCTCCGVKSRSLANNATLGRHNTPRIGRIPMARGRDATDVAIVTSFGPGTLASFRIFTDEVMSADPLSSVMHYTTSRAIGA
jgi:hypothetical protein